LEPGIGLDKGDVAKDDEASRNMKDLGQTIACWVRDSSTRRDRPTANVRE